MTNDVSVLHNSFPDISTFTVYMTAVALKKSFIFDITVKITGHVHSLHCLIGV